MKKKSIVVLIIIITSTILFAEKSPYYIGLGYSSGTFKANKDHDNFILKDKTSAIKQYIGYHLNDYISFELAYAKFNNIKDTFEPNYNSNSNITINPHLFEHPEFVY